jgi:hypothetical protein
MMIEHGRPKKFDHFTICGYYLDSEELTLISFPFHGGTDVCVCAHKHTLKNGIFL